MTSGNKRHFEIRLGKLGILTLVCSMSVLLFVFFLFGVVVGNNLEIYPEKISRQLPARILQWCGLLEYDKTIVVAAAGKDDKKQENQERETIPDVVVRHVRPDQEKPSSVKDAPPQTKPEAADGAVSSPPPSPPAKSIEEIISGGNDKEKRSENKYLVQVTSCKDKKVAEDVVTKIARIGFKAKITMVDLKEKGIWYRVILPSLGSRNEAMAAAQKIDQVLKGNQSVVRVQKG